MSDAQRDVECTVCDEGFVSISKWVPPQPETPRAVTDAEWSQLDKREQIRLLTRFGFQRDAVRIQRPGYFERSVAACLCRVGQLKTKHVVSIAKVMSADEIRALWPNGVPASSSRVTDRDLTAAGVPVACLSWTLNTLAEKANGDDELLKYVALAREWAKGGGRRSDVVIFGPNGTCKTGIAIAMLRATMAQGITGCFVPVKDLLDNLRATYRDDADESEFAVRHRFETVGVLVLDEVSGARGTDFAIDTLSVLIDKRQKNNRPTILTTNLGADLKPADATKELATFVGPALFDRLRERASFWAMFGKSRRPTNRKLVHIDTYRKGAHDTEDSTSSDSD